MEVDRKILSKSGLELELVQEEEEDVRLARLLNIQAKSGADEKKAEERGDIEHGNIFDGKEKVPEETKEKSGQIETGDRKRQKDRLK